MQKFNRILMKLKKQSEIDQVLKEDLINFCSQYDDNKITVFMTGSKGQFSLPLNAFSTFGKEQAVEKLLSAIDVYNLQNVIVLLPNHEEYNI